VTIEQAREEMSRIAAELEREYPDTNTQMGVGLGPLQEWFVGDVRKALVALMAAVALVLLIACSNVASLLLARATSRRREIAIRMALGASRLRLLRQLLTESLALSLTGGGLGVLLAYGAVVLLRAHGLEGVPRLEQVAVDRWVVVFAVATSCVSAVLFGLVPAWSSTRSAVSDVLVDGTRGATRGGAGRRRALIVAEVALSMVLLIGAGLLFRSFARLRGVDPGIDVTSALSFRVALPQQRYDTDERAAAFFSEAVGRLRAVPGVTAAGATVRLALEGRSWTGDLFIEGQPDIWGRELRHKSITSGYFAAAGARVLAGRDFDSGDTATGLPVVIINQTFAKRYFGGANPVGKRLAFRRPSPTTIWRTIVGVVADEKQDGLGAEVQPEVYDPHIQETTNTMSIVVRSTVDPISLLPAIRRELAALDPRIAMYNVRTLDQVVALSLAEKRFTTTLLSGFAGVAVLLAAVGLYGLVAFTVTERTREIGVRLALGAEQSTVLGMVIWDGLRVVAFGVAIGLASSLMLKRLIAGFLFHSPTGDPLVIASVGALLAAAGALASYVPARRAARVDPAISLRVE
jgi:putative ABC transport system permease protein